MRLAKICRMDGRTLASGSVLTDGVEVEREDEDDRVSRCFPFTFVNMLAEGDSESCLVGRGLWMPKMSGRPPVGTGEVSPSPNVRLEEPAFFAPPFPSFVGVFNGLSTLPIEKRNLFGIGSSSPSLSIPYSDSVVALVRLHALVL